MIFILNAVCVGLAEQKCHRDTLYWDWICAVTFRRKDIQTLNRVEVWNCLIWWVLIVGPTTGGIQGPSNGNCKLTRQLNWMLSFHISITSLPNTCFSSSVTVELCFCVILVVTALTACQRHTRKMEQSVGTGKLHLIFIVCCCMCLRSSLAVAKLVEKIRRVTV